MFPLDLLREPAQTKPTLHVKGGECVVSCVLNDKAGDLTGFRTLSDDDVNYSSNRQLSSRRG